MTTKVSTAMDSKRYRDWCWHTLLVLFFALTSTKPQAWKLLKVEKWLQRLTNLVRKCLRMRPHCPFPKPRTSSVTCWLHDPAVSMTTGKIIIIIFLFLLWFYLLLILTWICDTAATVISCVSVCVQQFNSFVQQFHSEVLHVGSKPFRQAAVWEHVDKCRVRRVSEVCLVTFAYSFCTHLRKFSTGHMTWVYNDLSWWRSSGDWLSWTTAMMPCLQSALGSLLNDRSTWSFEAGNLCQLFSTVPFVVS